MQAVILVGIQASGKSSFYFDRFRDSHLRLSLDMLRTRHRETVILNACLHSRQPFVVDNTNPAVEDRARYIAPSQEAGFEVIGYYFQSRLEDCLGRNRERDEARRIPDAGVRGVAGRLVVPRLDEGFSQLWYVSMTPGGGFQVEEWRDEVQ